MNVYGVNIWLLAESVATFNSNSKNEIERNRRLLLDRTQRIREDNTGTSVAADARIKTETSFSIVDWRGLQQSRQRTKKFKVNESRSVEHVYG